MSIFSFLSKRNQKNKLERKFCDTIIQYLWLQINFIQDEIDLPADLIGDVHLGTSFLYSINSLICSYDLGAQFRDSFIDSIFQILKPTANIDEARQYLCMICQDFQDELCGISPPLDSTSSMTKEDVMSFCHYVFSAAYPDTAYDVFTEFAFFQALTSFISFSYDLLKSSKLNK